QTQSLRTTFVGRGIRISTGDIVDVVGVGAARDLEAVQRTALRLGEVEARLPGADAEMTVLDYMLKNGIEPIAGGVSRPFCPICQFWQELPEVGGLLISPQQVIFRR